MQPYEKYVNPRIKAQEIFLQEVRRRTAEAEKALKNMETSGYHPDMAMVLYKFAFTLKGNGQMVGLWDIADPASDIMVALLLLGKYDVSWNAGILGFLQERIGDIRVQLSKWTPEEYAPTEEASPVAPAKKSKTTAVETARTEPAQKSPETASPVFTENPSSVPTSAVVMTEPLQPVVGLPKSSEKSPSVETPSPKPAEAPAKAASPAPATPLPTPPVKTAPAVPSIQSPPVKTIKQPEPPPLAKPAAEEPPEQPKQAAAPGEALEIQPERKILLVNDDPALDLVIQESLKVKGFQVLSAQNFKDAEEKLINQSPDLMVIDILKSPENRIKLCHAIRSNSRLQPIPIIFLSAQDVTQEKMAGYTTQADDYLAQPFKTGELVTRIQVILNRSDRTQELVYQDELTKLFNRRHLQKRLETELTFSQRTDNSFSLGMFNLDNFKRVNEMYGRLAGDETLICLIERIQANVRPTDLLCRYGEETFVILMPGTTKYEGFCFMDRVREAVSREPFPLWQRWLNIHLTISAGISSYPIDGESVDPLLKAAEANLQQAKHDGKNRVNM